MPGCADAAREMRFLFQLALTFAFSLPALGDGKLRVDSTASTKFLSSRRIRRLLCAIAKFARASSSSLSLALYASYAARLGKAISPQATLLVPSWGRKYPISFPPHR